MFHQNTMLFSPSQWFLVSPSGLMTSCCKFSVGTLPVARTRAAARPIIGGGGGGAYSYIRVLPSVFLLKTIAVMPSLPVSPGVSRFGTLPPGLPVNEQNLPVFTSDRSCSPS